MGGGVAVLVVRQKENEWVVFLELMFMFFFIFFVFFVFVLMLFQVFFETKLVVFCLGDETVTPL